MKKRKATKLQIHRETVQPLENEPLQDVKGAVTTIPCKPPTAFKTCATCCQTSCI